MLFEIVFVIGLGYIGLFIVVVFVVCCKSVIGVDVLQYVVDMINCGEIYIVEFEFDMFVYVVVMQGYLCVMMMFELVDVFLIVVLMLFIDGNKFDLSYIEVVC